MPDQTILSDTDLESSSVVANCRMNRERVLTGGNGYQREIGLHPLDFLRSRTAPGRPNRWLDLCCGSGRALFEATRLLADGEAIDIVGVDLVDSFFPGTPSARLQLLTASLHRWQPDGRFDLISCVHGLHYIGDKLGLIARAVSWLSDEGLFVANLDLANLRDEMGKPLGRRLTRLLREAGLEYDVRRKRLTCHGRREIRFRLSHVGADDTAGPNYTGQAAVNSLYRREAV